MSRLFLMMFASTILFNTAPVFAQEAADAESAAASEEMADDNEVAAEDAEQSEEKSREEQIEDAQAEVETKTPGLREPSPKLKELNDSLREMTINLDTNNRRHFFMIYNNHNMISTVKHVRDQVSNAIDACSENNPDMEQALRDRFELWTTAVNDKMTDAEAQRDNMIIAQDYTKPSEIRSILRQSDEIRDETNDAMEGVPVTTPEACEYLLNKIERSHIYNFLAKVC